MNVTLLFFATLRERAGVNRANMELPPQATVSMLKDQLVKEFPALKASLPTLLVAINNEFSFEDDEIPDGAEIALFPPVSGGSSEEHRTLFKIVEDAINLDELVNQISQPATGAVCVFTGLVRGITARDGGHETASLYYEAYIPMAEQKMAQVADEIRNQWPEIQGIAIVQRIGHLDVSTPTVLIACSAAHRDTGVFDAARYGIDRLKEIVPIWKREIGPDGEEWVEGDYLPQQGD